MQNKKGTKENEEDKSYHTTAPAWAHKNLLINPCSSSKCRTTHCSNGHRP